MRSKEHTELQTLWTRQMTTISCQLKRIQRWSTLIQRQWKWIQRMFEDHKWILWMIFKQVKIEINLRNVNQTAAMRTLLNKEEE